MGIQPGVTTPQQALSQLRSSDLVSYIGVSESLQTVAWYWNKKPFSLMDDTQIPALFYDRNEVSSIQISTRIRLGDLVLELDAADNHRVAIRQTGPYDSYNVDLYYQGNGYVLNAHVNCHSFWSQPTRLILGVRPQFIDNKGRLTTSLNNAKHLIDLTCRRNP